MFDKYLVTGATGFLGRTVVAELIKNGKAVKALVLENDELFRTLPKNADVVYGDVCDDRSLERFFTGADEKTCVIHCAGIISVASRPSDKIYKVNAGGTNNVVRRCERHGVGKLVYVSSVHAIPEKPKGRVTDEKFTLSFSSVRGDYAKSKAMATSLVFEAAKRGLNASVVFPSAIIGPGDIGKGSITNMLLSFLSGKLPLAVKGGYDFVDVRDVAAGILSCAERGRAGENFILSGHYATIRDVLDSAKRATGSGRSPLYLPICLAKLVAPIYEKRCLKKKKPLYFTPYAVSVLSSNSRFSRAAAEAAFCYSPRSIDESVEDMILWLRGMSSPDGKN